LDDRESRWRLCLQQIGSGESEALARLYEDTSSAVYGVALRVLGSAPDAEEVVLDVYQQVWRSAATYDSRKSRVLWWLFLLARSRALDRLRTMRRRQQTETAVAEIPEFPLTERFPEAVLLGHDVAKLRSALAALPQEQRRPLELAFYTGLTHVEIAEKLNAPLGTIKSRIRTAMRTLRDVLTEADGAAAGRTA
jgi:RNA polymerase sigma-70 factor (ECF subfamily)